MLNTPGAANSGTYFVTSFAYDHTIPARVGSAVDVRQTVGARVRSAGAHKGGGHERRAHSRCPGGS